jgi:prepilin-type N-terminal cleavage/methylation domain
MKVFRLSDKNGYALVEVLVSIVLVALLATFVAVFMAYWQVVRTQSNDMTKALNKVQQLIEEDYSDVKLYIQSNNATWLAANTTQSTVSMFGRDIKVYSVSESVYDDSGAAVITLTRGVANTYKVTPTIPQIASVSITANSADVDALYFAGTSSVASVKEPITLSVSENFKKYIYQWYVTDTYYHVLPLVGETALSEGNVIPGCPINFNFLSSEQNLTLTDLSQFKGDIIACLVTPGSKQGYMGDSVCSNYIYISPLPTLLTGSYFALYDASLLGYKDGYSYSAISNDTLVLNQLTSEIANSNGTYIKLSHTGKAYLNTAGDNTASEDTAIDYMSRYFHYTTGNKSTTASTSFSSGSKIYVYTVARNSDDSVGTFVSANTTGLISYAADEDGQVDDSWAIQSGNITLSSQTSLTFTFGNMNVDIAEALIVVNPSDADKTSIQNYLMAKYGIS